MLSSVEFQVLGPHLCLRQNSIESYNKREQSWKYCSTLAGFCAVLLDDCLCSVRGDCA